MTNIMQRAPWWQTGVIYQIYPRSFQDSNGDGVGDLRGHHTASAVSGRARSRRNLVVADLPVTDGRLRLRHLRLYRHRLRCSASLDDFDTLLAAAHRARPQGHSRSGAQPHVRSAPLVPGKPRLDTKSQARLVHLARSCREWRAAQQLAVSSSAAAPGNTTVQPDSITITPFWPRSRISTGAIRTSAPRSTR